MKDFRSIIGGDAESVKNLRVQTCIDSVCDESKMEIMNMRKQFRNLQMQRENLLDLGATSTTDIATNVKNVNAQELISKLVKNLDDLAICARRLRLRIAQHNILFPDNKEKQLDREELDFMNDLI